MAEDWKGHADEIAQELADIGFLFHGRRSVSGEYDPMLGAYLDERLFLFSVYGIFQSINSTVNFQSVVSEFSILEGDLLLQLVTSGTIAEDIPDAESDTYVPQISDIIEWEGAPWLIQGITSTQPGGIALLHQVFIRRA